MTDRTEYPMRRFVSNLFHPSKPTPEPSEQEEADTLRAFVRRLFDTSND